MHRACTLARAKVAGWATRANFSTWLPPQNPSANKLKMRALQIEIKNARAESCKSTFAQSKGAKRKPQANTVANMLRLAQS